MRAFDDVESKKLARRWHQGNTRMFELNLSSRRVEQGSHGSSGNITLSIFGFYSILWKLGSRSLEGWMEDRLRSAIIAKYGTISYRRIIQVDVGLTYDWNVKLTGTTVTWVVIVKVLRWINQGGTQNLTFGKVPTSTDNPGCAIFTLYKLRGPGKIFSSLFFL